MFERLFTDELDELGKRVETLEAEAGSLPPGSTPAEGIHVMAEKLDAARRTRADIRRYRGEIKQMTRAIWALMIVGLGRGLPAPRETITTQRDVLASNLVTADAELGDIRAELRVMVGRGECLVPVLQAMSRVCDRRSGYLLNARGNAVMMDGLVFVVVTVDHDAPGDEALRALAGWFAQDLAAEVPDTPLGPVTFERA